MSAAEATTEDRLYSQSMLSEIIDNGAIVRKLEKGTATQKEIADELGVSRWKVYRVARGKREGKALYDRRHDNPGRRSGITDDAIAYALQYQEHFPKAHLTDIRAAMERGDYSYSGQVPTYRQLRYTINNLPPDMIAIMRKGTKDYIQESALTARREEDYINAQWQIDATELPVYVIDVETGELVKPWVVGAIDSFSRVVPLAIVCRSHPTSADVLKGMMAAILPGGTNFAYGTPSVMIPDNASIFRSDEFMDAMLRAGIKLEFPPNNAPQAKGKIERFFLRLAQQFAAHLVGASDKSNGLAKARQGAIPFPCLQTLLDKWIRRYHATPHQAIGDAPWIRWNEHLAEAEGLVVNAKDIRDAFKLRRLATVHRDGIFVSESGWHLHSPDLEGLQDEEVVLRVPLDGTSNGVEAYWRGIRVADVKVIEGNTGLADAINKGRVRRTDELKEFRKMMKKRADKLPKFSSPAQVPPKVRKVEVTVATETEAPAETKPTAKVGRKKRVTTKIPKLAAEPHEDDEV